MKRKNPAAAALGRIGGSARARKLSPKERQRIARLGGLGKAAKAQNGASPLPPRSGIGEPSESEAANKKGLGADQLNHERDLKRQEKRLRKGGS